MNTKRKYKAVHDCRSYTYELDNGTLFPDVLVKGTEVQLKGRRGRYRFQYANQTSAGRTVLTFVGGPLHGQNDEFTSVYPDRVRRIHRTNKTLVNIAKQKG